MICVDWSLIAIDWTYIAARLRCKEIGNYIAELILMLTNNTYQEMDNIHILGFSMGAHIAGYAGKRLDGQLMRITGIIYKNIKYFLIMNDLKFPFSIK